jgi:uncharacterized protein YcbX
MSAVVNIYRYPVKGLGPDRLESTDLLPGKTIAADRLYAIENGPSGFDPAHPAYFPKDRFPMLMRNERLAALRRLSIKIPLQPRARGDLDEA